MKKIIESEGSTLINLNIIFTNDQNLLRINKKHLKHDFYTDVITFQYTEGVVDGEIFMSIDRIKENAEELQVQFSDELHRVLAHGVLHMVGYSDKTDTEAAEIRDKEDFYLTLLRHNVPRET